MTGLQPAESGCKPPEEIEAAKTPAGRLDTQAACAMGRSVAATERVAQTSTRQSQSERDMTVTHVATADDADGQPWPPPDQKMFWVIVRRSAGYTLWRSIQIESDPLPSDCTVPKATLPDQN
jgi:hypothetical protein